MTFSSVINDLQRAVALHQAGQLSQAEKIYRDVIRRAPENPDALNLLGLIAQARGKKGDALDYYNRALRVAPQMVMAHFNRGITLADLGRAADAEEAYFEATKLKPDYVDAHLNYGAIAYKRGDYATAVQRFRVMTQNCPLEPRGYRNLGQALQETKDYAAAASALERALALNNTDPDTLVKLANCYAALNKFEDAVLIIKRALKLSPEDGELYSNLGNWLTGLERYTEAHEAHVVACRMEPMRAEFFFNAANAYQTAGDMDKAIELFQRAIAIDPDYTGAYINMGEALKTLGRFDDAVDILDAALAREPQDTVAQINKAVVLNSKSMKRSDEGQYGEGVIHELDPALAILEDILLREPGNKDAQERKALLLSNKAEAYTNLSDVNAALDAYDRALYNAPEQLGRHNAAMIRCNKAITLLSSGRLAEGWPLYRNRFADPDIAAGLRNFPYPEWRGQSLLGKRLLLWTDQGIGDEVLYAGMLSEMISRTNGQCIIECSSRLVPLFQRSFPQVEVVARQDPADTAIAAFKPDYHSATTDLGTYLRSNLSVFPAHKGYLQVDAARRAQLRADYEARAGGRKIVGISWSSTSPKTGKFKSLRLKDWGPILKTPEVFFVSLQYGDLQSEIDQVRQAVGVDIFVDSGIDSLKDMDGFAAQVAAMDRVISVSNTAVHIAGALNVPVSALVPLGRGNLWYFRLGNTVPWYPSVRLVRQNNPGDWSAVVDQVVSELSGHS